ncbi:MAG: MBL fold metallo-hydrolase [Fusobacterium periodonticum]|nr:MBL fold metallo-hydrolase [Fusobacterium periodonticum]
MKKLFKILFYLLIIVIVFAISIYLFMKTPVFGALPSGKSLEKVKNSKNYIDGEFRNKEKTELLTDTKKTPIKRLLEFAFEKDPEGTVPKIALPSVKTDLKTLDPNEDLIVWFGHSSLFIQIAGKKILVDPVFSKYASPVPFSNKAFEGTNIYTVDDLPEIDILLITHDHYDHLDYPTIKKLKEKVAKVIVPLGVDAHFLRWDFDEEKIVTVDWDDEVTIDDNLKIYALETRHFSGREFSNRNQSLWVSYLIEEKYNDNLYRLFLSGDGGYSPRFKGFKEKFQNIDLAVMEAGQYNEEWALIHSLPEDIIKEVRDMEVTKLFPIHNSKFKLSKHPWDEPLRKLDDFTINTNIQLLTPMIGEKLYLHKENSFKKWWENLEK